MRGFRQPVTRRDFLCMGTAAMTGAFLAGCSPSIATPTVLPGMPDEKVTIRYWFYESPERTALGEKQVAEFQRMHPNITVDGRQAPLWVDNEDLLPYIEASANSHIHQSYYKEDLWYIDHDVIMPLEDLPGFQEVWNRLHPKCNYVWDGHVYSLSWYVGGIAIAYNKKLVEEAGLGPDNPPTTYSEFLGWAEALTRDTDGDGETDQWFIAPPLGEQWWWWDFVLSPFYIAATGSGNLLDETGKIPIFNTPEAIRPYELFAMLYREGYAPRESLTSDPFLKGRVAAQYPCWMSTHSDLAINAPPDFEYIMGPIPKPDDSAVEGNKTFLFVRNLALVKERQETGETASRIMLAAWEFLKFLLSPEQMRADFEVSGDPPAAKDVLTNPMYTQIIDRWGEQMKWHLEYVLEQGFLGDMTNVKSVDYENIVQQAYLKVVRDGVPPEEAIALAEEEVVDLLAE